MNKDDLRKVQLAQLDLLKELDRICKKNGISYFLVGGSALGAIRHAGFIPWDDDLDVGMLRRDFEIFKNVCKKDLDSDYEYQDWNNDPGYGLCFAKLRIKGTHYVEKQTINSNARDGIFIDVFPYDNVSKTIRCEKKDDRDLYFWKRAILAKSGYVPVENKVSKKLVYFLLKYLYPVSVSMLKKKIADLSEGNLNSDTDYVVTYGGAYGYWKERIRKSWVSDTIELNFEDLLVSVPKGIEDYLSKIYGDYMMLPPEDKRENRHGIIKLELGNYRIRSKMDS